MDRTWLYAGLLLAGGVGLAKILTQGPTIRRGERLLLVGDSLALGLAPPLGQLAKENGVVFDAVGQVGATVMSYAPGSKLNASLRSKLQAKPRVVLVSLGTNDEAMSSDAARAEVPALKALIQQITESGAALGWLGPPQFLPGQRFKPNGFTAMIQQAVPRADYFPSESYQIPRGNDNLHPTVRGYAGWAGAIWQWLRCCA